MFPIDMQHIGRFEAVRAVQVFGYSARKVDRDLDHVGPPTTPIAVRQRRRSARKLPEHMVSKHTRLLLDMGNTR